MIDAVVKERIGSRKSKKHGLDFVTRKKRWKMELNQKDSCLNSGNYLFFLAIVVRMLVIYLPLHPNLFNHTKYA